MTSPEFFGGLFFGCFREAFEVRFDDFAVVAREIFGDALEGLLASSGGKVSPAGFVADILVVDVPLAVSPAWHRILCGLPPLLWIVLFLALLLFLLLLFLLLLLLLLLLLFHFFDHFIELVDDRLLLVPNLLARSSQSQSSFDIVHQSGHFVEGILFEWFDIAEHQPSGDRIAGWNLRLSFEEFVQGIDAGLFLE